MSLKFKFVLAIMLCPALSWAVDDRWCQPPTPLSISDSEFVANRLVGESRRISLRGLRVTGLLNPVVKREDRGLFNLGVYRTPLRRGGRNQVLKIAMAKAFKFKTPRGAYQEFSGALWSGGGRATIDKSSARFREYLILHARLGDLGITPKINAVFEVASVLSLLQDHASGLMELADRGDFHLNEFESVRPVGILMDEVLDARALSRMTAPPEFMAEWSEAKLQSALENILQIRSVLVRNGIFPKDQQLVITREAKVWLIDTDAAFYDQIQSESIDFEMEMVKLIDDWESVTGRHLNASVLRSMKRRMKAAIPPEECVSILSWISTLKARACTKKLEVPTDVFPAQSAR